MCAFLYYTRRLALWFSRPLHLWYSRTHGLLSLYSSFIQQRFSKYLLGAVVFWLLNQGTPEIALQDSQAHTRKEPAFKLLTPGNINHQLGTHFICLTFKLSQRESGLFDWSLSLWRVPLWSAVDPDLEGSQNEAVNTGGNMPSVSRTKGRC